MSCGYLTNILRLAATLLLLSGVNHWFTPYCGRFWRTIFVTQRILVARLKTISTCSSGQPLRQKDRILPKPHVPHRDGVWLIPRWSRDCDWWVYLIFTLYFVQCTYIVRGMYYSRSNGMLGQVPHTIVRTFLTLAFAISPQLTHFIRSTSFPIQVSYRSVIDPQRPFKGGHPSEAPRHIEAFSAEWEVIY